ncbi:Uncharacterised protein [Mammaliicoccus lentus]|nr:hypothetical protein [Mammaliicoccus lentus]SUM50713.1 Uncharacterised protein [Mammaliicoccus lentus]
MKQLIIILVIVLLEAAELFTWNQYENNQIKKMGIKDKKGI